MGLVAASLGTALVAGRAVAYVYPGRPGFRPFPLSSQAAQEQGSMFLQVGFTTCKSIILVDEPVLGVIVGGKSLGNGAA